MRLRYTLFIILMTFVLTMSAQKITLGSMTLKDGGEYNGEMQAGKIGRAHV